MEWLSINYRKYRAAQKSKSNRRMVLELFEQDYQYFPSLQEVRDGLIKAQMKIIDNDQKTWQGYPEHLTKLKDMYIYQWKHLF